MSRRSTALFLILFLYTAQLIFVFGEVVTLAVGAGAVSALGMFIGDFAGIYSFAKCKCICLICNNFKKFFIS